MKLFTSVSSYVIRDPSLPVMRELGPLPFRPLESPQFINASDTLMTTFFLQFYVNVEFGRKQGFQNHFPGHMKFI